MRVVAINYLGSDSVSRSRELHAPAFTLHASSYDEATTLVKQVESERARWILIDYSRGHKITLAKLIIDEYIGVSDKPASGLTLTHQQQVPEAQGQLHKSYTLTSMPADFGYETNLARLRGEAREAGAKAHAETEIESKTEAAAAEPTTEHKARTP
jgi:hypothetical protein